MDGTSARRPLRIAARFLVAATALYALWLQVGSAYEQTLVEPAGWLLQRLAANLALAHDGVTAVVGLQRSDGTWRAFALQQPGDTYLSLVVALALLVALPGLTARRRLAWGVAAIIALWGSHVLVLYGGACSAVGVYLADLPPDAASPLAGLELTAFGEALGPAALVGMWTAWAAPAAMVVWAALVLPANLWRND